MKNEKMHKVLFVIAAWYDLILGFVFFLLYKLVYSMFMMELPENPAYLQLAAAFVFVQGLLYYYVYKNLQRNVDIVKVGVAYKVAYAGVSFYYFAVGQLPHPIFALFGLFDVVFIVFFIWYLMDYRKSFPA